MVQKTVYEYIYIYRHKCGTLYTNLYLQMGFPVGASGKESACRCRRCQRHRFDPGVRKIFWRRKGQPTPVFLPGKFHGQRSLVGYSLWGLKELDTTEWAHVCNVHTSSFATFWEWPASIDSFPVGHVQFAWRRKGELWLGADATGSWTLSVCQSIPFIAVHLESLVWLIWMAYRAALIT